MEGLNIALSTFIRESVPYLAGKSVVLNLKLLLGLSPSFHTVWNRISSYYVMSRLVVGRVRCRGGDEGERGRFH